MRTTWTIIAALAVALLAATDADAFGRRCRGGGGCSSGMAYGGFVGGCGGGGCDLGGYDLSGGFASGGFAAFGGISNAGGFGFARAAPSAWAWRNVGNDTLLEDLHTGTLYARDPDGVFRATGMLIHADGTIGRHAAGNAPGNMPTGGASAALAADRANRPTAVFTIDPLTGVRRQVGWMNADGSLHGLGGGNNANAPETVPPRKQ